MLDIEVLGTGCMSCNRLVEIAKEAVSRMGPGFSSRVTKVEDYRRMAELGVMSLPALVVNNRLISAGKVYKVNELITVLLAEVAK